MRRPLYDFRLASRPVAVLILLLLSSPALFAQDVPATAKPPTVDQFVGNYKGTAKSPEGDVPLTLEIKSDKGKISGRLVTPKGEEPLTSGEVEVSKLTIKLGSGPGASQLALQLRDDKAVGEWKTGGQTRAVEFRKVLPATEATAAEVAKPATGPSSTEALSGEWEAAADVQGQAFPFSLSLKVEGDKVAGSSSSQLGNSTISSGSWKDGKLALVIEGGNGQIVLIGAMVDGKLIGDFDYGGQLSGKWIATKKTP